MDLLPFLLRDADQLADDLERYLQRELLDEIEFGLAGALFEQRHDALADERFERGHAVGSEYPGDERLVPAMLRRILDDQQWRTDFETFDGHTAGAGIGLEVLVP